MVENGKHKKPTRQYNGNQINTVLSDQKDPRGNKTLNSRPRNRN